MLAKAGEADRAIKVKMVSVQRYDALVVDLHNTLSLAEALVFGKAKGRKDAEAITIH